MPYIERIERFCKEPLAVGSQLSVTARASGFTVILLMTIAEFVPERSVVMQGKAPDTNVTHFYCVEPASGRAMAATGGDVQGL